MRTLTVNLGKRSYDIVIQGGGLDRIGTYLKRFTSGCKAFILTDDTVAELYGGRVADSLRREGFLVHTFTFPHGEQSKTMDTLGRLVGQMLDAGLTRTDHVVALGGGVVGDTAGFAAHIALRGVPYVQIPTTLLAQVDSSVGGKVAVDVPQGKNLVGAFHQPEFVLIDPDCLQTLSDEVFADGMAEVIKYGFIKSASLLDVLTAAGGRAGVMQRIGDVVYECVDIKRRVVEADELDTGGRMVLNFGHTLGHVMEKHHHYTTYTHGQAVAAGMVAIARVGEWLGESRGGLAEEVRAIVQQFGLPDEIPLSASALGAVAMDKKSDGSQISAVFVRAPGESVVRKLDTARFVELAADTLGLR